MTDRRMKSEVRDTWPCPGAGKSISDLTDREILILNSMKLDVVGREVYQLRSELDMVQHEVNRHGCRLGLTEVPGAPDTPETAPLTPKAAGDRY